MESVSEAAGCVSLCFAIFNIFFCPPFKRILSPNRIECMTIILIKWGFCRILFCLKGGGYSKALWKLNCLSEVWAFWNKWMIDVSGVFFSLSSCFSFTNKKKVGMAEQPTCWMEDADTTGWGSCAHLRTGSYFLKCHPVQPKERDRRVCGITAPCPSSGQRI